MFRLDEILKQLNIEAEFTGCPEFDSLGLIEAKQNNRICSFLKDPSFAENISENVKLIMTDQKLADSVNCECVCIVDDPWASFFKVHNMLSDNPEYCREEKPNEIGMNCRMSKDARLDDSNIVIGNNVVIEEFVSIKRNTVIGDDTYIGAGTRIGEEGFEFKKNDHEFFYVKHVGGLIIGNNVRIMHNTSIDKAIYPWADTLISDECIVSSQVEISHSVELKKRVAVASNVFIGGRTEVNDDVWIGPGAVISNGLKIGAGARVNIGSVVTRNVDDGASVSGNFAVDHDRFIDHIRKIR